MPLLYLVDGPSIPKAQGGVTGNFGESPRTVA